MVIGPPKAGISAFVVLSDDEYLPEKFNHEKVVVFRCGKSTNREMVLVKPLGKLAEPELLRSKQPPVCNYVGDGNPLHQHQDGKWWFFDKDFVLENGPFDDYEQAYGGLEIYCIGIEKMRELAIEMQTCERCHEVRLDVESVPNPVLLAKGDDSMHFLCGPCCQQLINEAKP